MPIPQGSIFGEVGLISGRRRGATIRAGENCIVIEIPRTAALKLMAQVQEAREAVNRITTERQILQMFRRLKRHHGAAFIFITHDMSVAAALSDRIAVMYAGQIVELGPVRAIFDDPKHPYTVALIRTPR